MIHYTLSYSSCLNFVPIITIDCFYHLYSFLYSRDNIIPEKVANHLPYVLHTVANQLKSLI